MQCVVDDECYQCTCRYINGVKPGEYGVRLPFYFPCLPSYWIGNKATVIEVSYILCNLSFECQPNNTVIQTIAYISAHWCQHQFLRS